MTLTMTITRIDFEDADIALLVRDEMMEKFLVRGTVLSNNNHTVHVRGFLKPEDIKDIVDGLIVNLDTRYCINKQV